MPLKFLDDCFSSEHTDPDVASITFREDGEGVVVDSVERIEGGVGVIGVAEDNEFGGHDFGSDEE